eukprot:Colp12_sorted_trinity150504_noHs@12202
MNKIAVSPTTAKDAGNSTTVELLPITNPTPVIAPAKPDGVFMKLIKAKDPSLIKFTLFMLLVLSLYIAGIVIFKQRGGSSILEYNNPGDDKIGLSLRVAAFTPNLLGGVATISVRFSFPDDMKTSVWPPRLKTTFTVYFDDVFVTFPAGTVVTDTDFSFKFYKGSVLDYPWDVYTHECAVLVFTGDGNSITRPDFSVTVDTSSVGPISVDGKFVIAKTPDDSDMLNFTLQRTTLAKVYPMVVILGIWSIIVSQLSIVFMFLVLKWKKVDNPAVLGMYGGMIFALPNLRNSMPQVPPIGGIVDFSAFFWAEASSMICLLYLSWRFAYDSKPAEKK